MMDRGQRLRIAAQLSLVWFVLCASALANDASRTQTGHDIVVGPNEKTGELTCFGCSIRVRGEVAGDVTAFGGGIVIESPAQVAGDITGFGGDVRLDKGTNIAGDVTVFGGKLRRDPEATIAGDVTSMSGRGWLVLIFLTPVIILGMLIALVVWLIQRSHRRPPVSAAA
jgi:cytoskeletal protein CcmA (bactofilin family)